MFGGDWVCGLDRIWIGLGWAGGEGEGKEMDLDE